MSWWRVKVPGPTGNQVLRHPHPVQTPGPMGVNDAGDPRAQPDTNAAGPEKHWTGSLKGELQEGPSLLHTLNNYGTKPLKYLLRIKNTGYCLLCLGTQFDLPATGEQQEWIAGCASRGNAFEVENGLEPNASLHLRLFGQKDYTDPKQYLVEGTLEVILQN